MVAAVNPLMAKGLLRWSVKFWTGPLPVTMAWMKNPNMENIACSRMCFETMQVNTQQDVKLTRQTNIMR